MSEAVKYISKYGISLLVIALVIIAIIGILKKCKVFNKLPSKNIKKAVYYALDIALAFGLTALYFVLFKQGFSKYLTYTGAEICVVTALYAIYENFGVRKLVEITCTLIRKHFAKNKNSKLAKLVQQVGIEKSLIEIQNLIVTAQQEHKNE